MTKNHPNTLHLISDALNNAAIVARTDVRGTITFANSKFCEISGYSEEELIGANHRILRSGVHDKAFFRDMYRVITQGGIWHGEICNRRKNGNFYWVDTTIVPHFDDAGRLASYTAVRFDITGRKQAESELLANRTELEKAVNIDGLTGLPNRRCFQEHLEGRLRLASSSGSSLCLALLDIDAFKEINDTFGHDTGDQLLKTVASRLRTLAGDTVFIARLGGDEFAIVIDGMPAEEAGKLVHAAQEALRAPFSINDRQRHSTTSIGIALCPEHASDTESLFKMADIALYYAKGMGRDRCERFHSAFKDAIDRRGELLGEIETGLGEGQFSLSYQPIVDARPGRPVSLEALLRWQHPHLGLISPERFAEGMRDPAIQAEIGFYVLKRALTDYAAMNRQGMAIGRVAINLTNADLRSETFIDRFFELCKTLELDPSHLCVEVTEGMFLGRNLTQVRNRLKCLHDAGVEIALDDFGTGYASLTHLRQLPFDRLKIDRSFITNIMKSPEDLAIVRGMVGIAHNLGKTVTAEGVETLDQAKLLLRLGCDHLQGWYFAKATAPELLQQVVASMPGLPPVGIAKPRAARSQARHTGP
ncbi:EAL domain-containing protein [Rhizobiaceae bacterium BDR2-2]|uniref:EAL domain-containing protein n=1 Tax=Ectorhizobium quercum TaxID=2965071 RepID=A0AAE3MVI1_9HYPH|nr:EAL domain-containing protein [Ectorhizobium quercum]MCX8995698.1 EAL domain-containing protein [Ectorhizobium quercum]